MLSSAPLGTSLRRVEGDTDYACIPAPRGHLGPEPQPRPHPGKTYENLLGESNVSRRPLSNGLGPMVRRTRAGCRRHSVPLTRAAETRGGGELSSRSGCTKRDTTMLRLPVTDLVSVLEDQWIREIVNGNVLS